MSKNIFSIGFFFLIMISCRNEQPTATVSVSGFLPALADKMLYLEELEVRKIVPIDSVKINSEGKFNFNFEVEDAGFYILKTSSKNTLILQLEKNENVILNAQNDHFGWDYEVKGSTGTMLLQQFEKFIAQQKTRIDSLGEVYNEARGSEDFIKTRQKLDSVYQAIVDKQRAYVLNYIKEHPQSLTSLLVINRNLGQTIVIDDEKDYVKLMHLDSTLSIVYPDNKHVQDHHQRLKEIKGRIFDNYVAEEKLSPGRKAPDIVLPDTSGNPFSLKSYTGSPVLVYFWAGWSAPSRRDNQRLKKQFNFFEEKETRILGVSLDENEMVWKGALKLDKLPWQQVGDLQGLNSPIKKEFHVPDELPYYYLLDKELKIVYKNASLDSIMMRMD